jgi:hypothetical protein
VARIRSVKPEYWDDQELAEQVSRDARLLYIGLWNLADEHGRLRGDARLIKGRIFPYDDDVTIEAVAVMTAELALAGKVLPYQVDGVIYLYLPNLGRHQRLEADKVASKLPDQTGHDAEMLSPRALIDACRSETRANKSARRAEKIALLYGSGSMEHVSDADGSASGDAHTDSDDSADDDAILSKAALKAKAKEGKLPSAHPRLSWEAHEIDADPEWIKFWEIYPSIKDKATARTKWLGALRDGVEPAKILAGAEAYAQERSREDPKFNKSPKTWLHNRCWEEYDERPKQPTVPAPRPFYDN